MRCNGAKERLEEDGGNGGGGGDHEQENEKQEYKFEAGLKHIVGEDFVSQFAQVSTSNAPNAPNLTQGKMVTFLASASCLGRASSSFLILMPA